MDNLACAAVGTQVVIGAVATGCFDAGKPAEVACDFLTEHHTNSILANPDGSNQGPSVVIGSRGMHSGPALSGEYHRSSPPSKPSCSSRTRSPTSCAGPSLPGKE